MKSKQVYAIEGLDRLGKSTLIQGIKQTLGFYQTIHFGKPEKLSTYENSIIDSAYQFQHTDGQLFNYQSSSFTNSMIIANSGARVIFDRWHLGEAVYSPLYRGYNGDYVFFYEKLHKLHLNAEIRMILLTEDFSKSKHFIDDGLSFDISKREAEQQMFIDAFNKSIIQDKRIVCVTADNGQFKPKERILKEVLV